MQNPRRGFAVPEAASVFVGWAELIFFGGERDSDRRAAHGVFAEPGPVASAVLLLNCRVQGTRIAPRARAGPGERRYRVGLLPLVMTSNRSSG